ncbi:MAG: class I SAM-dependent methyltransferase [Terriglobia bacterium]
MNGQGKPVVPPGCRRILDVGCGDGGGLMEAGVPDDDFIVATDLNWEALQACREKFPSISLVCSSAEQLPYRTGAFDAYLARSAWPYTNLRQSTGEAFRVLAAGGSLWVTARTASTAFVWWRTSLRKRYLHGVLFNTYTIVNGAFLHVTGRNFRFPFRWSGMSRYESFQTRRSLHGLLRRAGFDGIQIVRRNFFEVTATKAGEQVYIKEQTQI